MEFEENQNNNGGYSGQYAQEPQSNATVEYSPQYGNNEGSDEDQQEDVAKYQLGS